MARKKATPKAADADEPLITLSQARAWNRGVYSRTIAIIAVLGMVALGFFGYNSYNDLQSKQSPCATDLASKACIARFCISTQEAGYPLSQVCKAALQAVNKGKVNPGPGADRIRNIGSRPTLGPQGQSPQQGGTNGGPPTSSNPGASKPGSTGGSGGGGTTSTPSSPSVGSGVNKVLGGVNDVLGGTQSTLCSVQQQLLGKC